MSNDPKPPKPTQLLYDLQHDQALKHQRIAGTPLDPQLALLRTWQSERLKRTYADLLADKRFRPACNYFLRDIYAPRDFTQRDHDVERVYTFLAKIAPAQMLQPLTDLITLNTLTNDLDARLLMALVGQLNMADSLTPEMYAEAYRICDNYDERVYQIELNSQIITQMAEGTHLPMAGIALKMIKLPAHRAGWDELYTFLEHGFEAFKRLRDIKLFVATIEQREKLILDRIFANQADPFAV